MKFYKSELFSLETILFRTLKLYSTLYYLCSIWITMLTKHRKIRIKKYFFILLLWNSFDPCLIHCNFLLNWIVCPKQKYHWENHQVHEALDHDPILIYNQQNLIQSCKYMPESFNTSWLPLNGESSDKQNSINSKFIRS